MPLAPWISASHSISTSHHCQNGSAHLPATNPKSMALTPSPTMRFAMRWPKMSTTSTTPETRMYIQPHFSRLTRRFGAVRAGVRGDSMTVISAFLFAEDVDEVPRHERDHRDDPEGDHDVEEHLLVAGRPRPEVDEDDPQAVEGVEHDRADERDLAEPHDGRLVRADDRVVRFGTHPDERGVEDVHEEEEEDGDTGDAVQHP